MSNRIHLATALALSVATLAPTHAARADEAKSRFYVPAVVGAAYADKDIATSAAEIRHQGGFATAGTVRWLAAAPVDAALNDAPRFYLPGVVGAALRDGRIATSGVEVRRQGGFATAGTVRWLPSAPVEKSKVAKTAKAATGSIEVSALD